nr:hypothetical protein [Chlamydiota bacterium]
LSNQKNWTVAMFTMGVAFGLFGAMFLAAHFAPGAAHLPNNAFGHTVTWMQHNPVTGILFVGMGLVALGAAGGGFRHLHVMKGV